MSRAALLIALVIAFAKPPTDRPARRPAAKSAPRPASVDFPSRFGRFDGCFVLKEVGGDVVARYASDRCAQRLSPCSTFKVCNALIGLDSGVVSGPDHLLKWDGKPQSRKECERDHTLATAIRDSVVWYFQEVARRIGPKRMQVYLDKLAYGNRDISAGIDRFWLETSLRISADEQLKFMERLYADQLPIGKHAQAAVRGMIVLESGPGWTFSGKTGTGGDGKTAVLGWFVGHIRSKERDYVFVANIRAKKDATGAAARRIVLTILKDLGLIPK